MTPKEKAEELIENYDETLTYLESKSKAKQCALIAVDEILIIQEYWGGINNTNYQYWQEVKQEILLDDIFNEEKKKGVKELIDKHKQETLEEAAERLQKDKYGIFISKDADVKGQLVIDTGKAAFSSGMNEGAKWQQEQIGKSEFLQRLRGTLSDAEARRLIFETFNK